MAQGMGEGMLAGLRGKGCVAWREREGVVYQG